MRTIGGAIIGALLAWLRAAIIGALGLGGLG